MKQIRKLIDKEVRFQKRFKHRLPAKLHIGAMVEVPSLLFELDALLPQVEFVSIGSNDLMQFLFAADRTNAAVGSRYDPLSVAPLRALQTIARACRTHKVGLTLCGEMAGRPVEAMALIGLGYRSFSMAPASVGPVKAMILSLDAKKVTAFLSKILKEETGSVRSKLEKFAKAEGIKI